MLDGLEARLYGHLLQLTLPHSVPRTSGSERFEPADLFALHAIELPVIPAWEHVFFDNLAISVVEYPALEIKSTGLKVLIKLTLQFRLTGFAFPRQRFTHFVNEL